ncbi:hypothetical protein PVAP13_3KG392900 [Panicum virgatum]|uniref:Uncharacterized protein n=1 Tax=Panicum virgatum TaxID=38727 RepID=A0A8T0V964_PANVG|nr:hypothetical protein PVAP13_3KG392900 [Panicum virgatum]
MGGGVNGERAGAQFRHQESRGDPWFWPALERASPFLTSCTRAEAEQAMVIPVRWSRFCCVPLDPWSVHVAFIRGRSSRSLVWDSAHSLPRRRIHGFFYF